MPLEKGSLVLLEYTARVKDTSEIFETTREDEAKKTEHYDPTRKYGPKLVSVGESWVLKGLDEALANANVGDKMNVEILPDKGFGDRDPNKVRMIPQRKLGDKADEVSVGDVIEVEERTGIVRYIGSGRIQVDFNHRFAGRTLLYDVDVIKKLDTDEEKVGALVKRRFGLDDSKIKIKLASPELEIELSEEAFLAEGLQIIKRATANDIFKFVPAVKDVRFVETYHQAITEQKKPEEPKQAATAEVTR
ncbi:MAG: FKBP-type peptidyl-prolyl cis-trans isomerase [Nitrososphaera sp.]